jgi:parallel beta-helix repeat protein
MFRRFLAAALLCAACPPLLAQNAIGFGQLDAYGTLQAGGVVAGVSGDANRNASARLEWRLQGESSFRAGHPLARVDATHFVGSLFQLAPGRTYEVRVTLADPDGTGATPTRTSAFATRAEAGAFAPLRTLYVAPNGSDANDGTAPARAVKTIQRAADLARAGDLVSIAAGVYRESVRVAASGTAAQPIVFRGAAGAVLDGADAAIAAGAAWNDAGGGVWSRTTGFATAHAVADQGRLFRYASLTELRTLAAGAPGGFFFDGTTLWLKFADGSRPPQRQVHVARLNEGFNLAGVNHVRVENLEIRHYGADIYGKGVYLRYSSDCGVAGNRIHDIGSAGVWIKGGERNLVEHNEIADTSIANWPWGLTKGGSAENNAVAFTDDVGRGNVIRRNAFHGTFNGIGSCGSAPPPSGFSNETDIYENTFADHADDATETEGYCANVRLWGNRIRDSLMAFAIAPAGTGPVWIVRNVAYDIGNTRSALVDGQSASGIKINSGYSTPVGPTFVYHNTFLTTAPATDAIWLMSPGYSSGMVSRNNVYAGTDRAFVKDNPIALDLDYDALDAGGQSLVWWQGTRYANLAALQAGTAQELHGIEAAPALAGPADGDFTPAEASALIDRALALPGINDGHGGAAPDIGAVERNDPIFGDGFD